MLTIAKNKHQKSSKPTSLLFFPFLPPSTLSPLLLTSAVGEAPVAGGTLRAVAADDVGPAPALATEGLAGVALGANLVAAAGQRAVVEERRQRHGRPAAERRGLVHAGTSGRREVGRTRQSMSVSRQKHALLF